jgi:hypothetical protein
MKASSEPVSKSKGNGATRKSNGKSKSISTPGNDACSREEMIAVAAYFHAERRGFTPDNDLADWLQAEAEVKGLLI